MKKIAICLFALVFLSGLWPAGMGAHADDSDPQSIADWVRMARIGGFEADIGMTDTELNNLVLQRKSRSLGL